jgi:short-subunit dehydrogenase
MRARSQKGLIAFTSSPGGFMPSLMAPLYSATKSFVTNFACSIAGECVVDEIDVIVVHPLPINTTFY